MALSIKHPEADKLARELAKITGESLTEAIVTALRERLQRLSARRSQRRLLADLEAIRKRVAKLPVLDGRTADEIIGYDEHGIPR